MPLIDHLGIIEIEIGKNFSGCFVRAIPRLFVRLQQTNDVVVPVFASRIQSAKRFRQDSWQEFLSIFGGIVNFFCKHFQIPKKVFAELVWARCLQASDQPFDFIACTTCRNLCFGCSTGLDWNRIVAKCVGGQEQQIQRQPGSLEGSFQRLNKIFFLGDIVLQMPREELPSQQHMLNILSSRFKIRNCFFKGLLVCAIEIGQNRLAPFRSEKPTHVFNMLPIVVQVHLLQT